MKYTSVLLGITAIALVACQEKKTETASDDALRDQARELAQKFILVDTHVDFPERLQEIHFQLAPENLGIPVNDVQGDFDFERARKGGLDAPFMSIYIPSRYQKLADNGKGLADSLITLIEGIATSLPDKYALAKTPQDIEANTKAGKISLPMGMENGAPLGDKIENVKYFYDRGIRYITLTHAKNNKICDSSYDSTVLWNGLSPFGEKVVAEMQRTGIMVDISHVTDSTFFDVIRIAKAPVIASHSSCRFFTPGFQRNMSDDMIKALGKNGGVIQINFGASFLDSLARTNIAVLDTVEKKLKAQGLSSRDSAAQPVIDQYSKNHVALYSDVDRVADHIDHVVKLIGIDHVGIGSDFDGVGDSLPLGLKDVSEYPNLFYVLLKRGYTPEDIEKICSKNVFRVWNEVIAASQASASAK
jgi:membrane dipeptidase